MRSLSNNLLAEMLNQESTNPFLTLLTLSHSSISTIRIVNDIQDITSNGNLFTAFPFKLVLPVDDGETVREVRLEIDNTSLELIDEFRTVTDYIDVNIQMVLASTPDIVEIELTDLKLKSVSYNASSISATLFVDDFLNTELTNEKYTPANFPGIFN